MKRIYVTIAVLFTVVESGEKRLLLVLDLTTFVFPCFEFGDTVDRLIQTVDRLSTLRTCLQ